MGWFKGVNIGKIISKNRKYYKVDKHMKVLVIVRWKNIKERKEYHPYAKFLKVNFLNNKFFFKSKFFK